MDKHDWRILAAAGAGMLCLAGGFLWRDLQVQPEVLLVVASVLGAGVALWSRGRQPLLGPAAMIACTLAGGAWYAIGRSPLLLIGLAASWAAALLGIALGNRAPHAAADRVHNVLLWHGFVLASVVTSCAVYFQFLTLGIPDHIGRRLVLSLLWLLAATLLMVTARVTGRAVARDAAFGFVAMALAKAILYDSAHLDGWLRVGEFAVAALLLWSAAWVARSRQLRSP